MWLPSSPEISKYPASVFLISSWHELFYAFTPDANQPRLHNVSSLIDELADISERCQREARFKTHVTLIQQELEHALDEEESLLDIPEYLFRARSLQAISSPVGVLTGCRFLMEQKDQYERAFFEYAANAIEELPRKKKAAHNCIRRIASFAFQHGKEDDDVWEPLNKDTSRETAAVLKDIVDLSTAGPKKYLCTLAIVGHLPVIHAAIRMGGLAPIAQSRLPSEYVDEITEPNDQLMFVALEVEATSIRSAVSDSRKKLGIATGLVSLYQNALSHVHPLALVQVDHANIVFSQSEQAFRRLHPRSNPIRDVQHAMEMLKDHKVDERLLAAIEFLSLASSSSDPRVRLINSWSSIETLSGGHEGQTTLERVSSLVVPLVISRHVGRTTRYLAIETQRFGSHIGNSDYGVGFPQSTSKFVAPTEMLKTLASPKNSQSICDLLKFAENPLLRYRIYRSWETMHNPKKLSATLEISKKRLRWHIARIYRARNLLVHQGVESPYLVPLLDNLQNYISMAVQRLIHELKRHPRWDIRHGIEYWKGNMDYILSSLPQNPDTLTTGDFIDGTKADKIWPT